MPRAYPLVGVRETREKGKKRGKKRDRDGGGVGRGERWDNR